VSVPEIHAVARAAGLLFAFGFWLLLVSGRQPREEVQRLEIRIVQGEGCALSVDGERFELPGASASTPFDLIISTPQGGSVRVELHQGGTQ
jgi:hypothetical protein